MSVTTPVRDRWAVIGAYLLVGAANQMLWLTFTPITTPTAHHYGVSVNAVGWLSEIFPLLYIVLAVPAASMLDRRFRSTLAAGAALTALGGVLRLTHDTYAWALIGQLLVAIAQPMILNAVTGLASGYLTAKSRPVGIALGSAGIFLGMLLSLTLGSALGGARLHTILVINAIFAVVAAIVFLAALATGGPLTLSGDVTGVFGLKTVWRDRGIRRLAMIAFIGFGFFVAFTTWLQTLLKPAGLSASTAGWLLVATVFAGVVGSMALSPSVIRNRTERALFMAAGLCLSGSCVVFAFCHSVPVIAVAAAVSGFLMLACLPVILEIAERRAGPAGISATALIWLAGNAGGIVIALLVQTVVHRPTAAFLLMGVIALGVVALVATESVEPAAQV